MHYTIPHIDRAKAAVNRKFGIVIFYAIFLMRYEVSIIILKKNYFSN